MLSLVTQVKLLKSSRIQGPQPVAFLGFMSRPSHSCYSGNLVGCLISVAFGSLNSGLEEARPEEDLEKDQPASSRPLKQVAFWCKFMRQCRAALKT